MAYHLVNNERTPVKFGGGMGKMVRENYVPAQNTDMIYIGIFISVLALLLLLYILYRKSKQ
jgi:hypothetical protein